MTETERKAELKEQAKMYAESTKTPLSEMPKNLTYSKPPEILYATPAPTLTNEMAKTQPTPTVIERSDEFKKFQEQKSITEYYMKEQALPKNLNAGQAMMIIEIGRQVGLSMFEALN